MNRIIRVFLDTDMRNQHEGLTEIAQSNDVNLLKLKQGEHVIFVNTKMNKLKMYSHAGVLSYVRADGRIDLGMIQMIPQCFEGSAIDWTKAARLSLEKKLGIPSK